MSRAPQDSGRRGFGRRAVFLDRDGTLMVDTGYPRDPGEVALIPGAVEALRTLRNHGFLLVLVSNQSGVGRGLITSGEASAVHNRLVEMLHDSSADLDASYYCPHAPDQNCTCRKPSPELLHRAAEEHGIDLTRSFMIGDKLIDVETGDRAGCKTIFLDWKSAGSAAAISPDLVAHTWNEAVRFIVSRTESLQ